ncbi:uncharacterized protein [Hyperolius riggenbachi]|uniref:uncharacterized protein n=1 Tax=Hyperolius riggenbachi TaxID=752182 RepID=UPI0035A30F29
MEGLEDLLARVREEATTRGPTWVQVQLAAMAPSTSSQPAGAKRKSRPPERLSPDPHARQRRNGSPHGDPPAPPAKRASASASGAAGRNPHAGRGSSGGATSATEASAPPATSSGSNTALGTRSAQRAKQAQRTNTATTGAASAQDTAAAQAPSKGGKSSAKQKKKGGSAGPSRKQSQRGASGSNSRSGQQEDTRSTAHPIPSLEPGSASEVESLAGEEIPEATGSGLTAVQDAGPAQPVGQVPGGGPNGGGVWGALSSVDVGSSIRAVSQLISRSLSESSWAAYTAVWNTWDALMTQVGGCHSDDDRLGLLLYFVGNSYSEGVSVSAMNKKVAALAFWFKLRGFQDVTKDFRVRQALKGYRAGGVQRDSRRPVTFELLGKLVGALSCLCASEYEASLFKTAFTLSFFGAFRVGELVSPNKHRVGGILAPDVAVQEDSVSILLRRSKTDQASKGRSVSLFRIGGPLCPRAAVESFMAIRPPGATAFLAHADGIPLTRFQFTAIFRKCLAFIGFPPAEFASHSFRIGAATEASRWGLSEEVIKKIGRWESVRFRSYIRPHLV